MRSGRLTEVGLIGGWATNGVHHRAHPNTGESQGSVGFVSGGLSMILWKTRHYLPHSTTSTCCARKMIS